MYYIKSINMINLKSLFQPDFSPNCTHEKSQSNPRHARTLKMSISTQF
nr:MAG TPA: hypothetical protein [Caudoviricetes sp.]